MYDFGNVATFYAFLSRSIVNPLNFPLHFQIEAILGEHGIVVITRSGNCPEKFIFQSDLLTKYKKKIDIVTNWVPNEISSTLARRHLRRGLSVKYMLDDNVVEYIRQQKMYGVDST